MLCNPVNTSQSSKFCLPITGLDFETIPIPRLIEFSPDMQRIAIPMNITEDDVLEKVEQFTLNLLRPEDSQPFLPEKSLVDAPPYALVNPQSVSISIVDNEGKSVTPSFSIDFATSSFSHAVLIPT